jgi:hypothetical protein
MNLANIIIPQSFEGKYAVAVFSDFAGRNQLSLLDLSGRIMTQVRDIFSAGQHNYNIQIGKEGIYFLMIIQAGIPQAAG